MNILGIRFSPYGATQYYSVDMPEPIQPGQLAVVESDQGLAIGEVLHVWDVPAQGTESFPPILRLANDADATTAHSNALLADTARHFCQNCIRDRHLEMKLVDVEVYYNRSKIVFYFTAPARIDFRELVKDLVREYRSRIELRQIGVRHETQMVGAVGNCGMVCCCRRFLRKFAPVTIRMAKEQNLFLNPAKISGICGRLLCCLSYEQENYDAFHRTCPRLGKKYTTDKGVMKVLRANMFRNTVSVLSENNEELEFTLEDWQALAPRRPEQASPPPAPAKPPVRPPDADNGLLVVSVSPDTVEDLNLLDDDALPDDGGGIFGLLPSAARTPTRTSEQAPANTAAAPAPAHTPAHPAAHTPAHTAVQAPSQPRPPHAPDRPRDDAHADSKSRRRKRRKRPRAEGDDTAE